MKKRNILAILCMSLLLTSCNEFAAWSLPNSSNNSSSEEQVIPISSSDLENKVLKSIQKDYVKTSFYTGDIYSSALEVRILAKFTDGTSMKFDEGFDVKINSFSSDNMFSCSQDEPILRAGTYSSKIRVSYTLNGVTKTFSTKETNTFSSVLEEGIDECQSFQATLLSTYAKNEIVANKIHLRLNLNWRNHGQELYYINQVNDLVNLVLHSDSEQTENIINNPFVNGTRYHLVVTIGSLSQTIDFELARAFEYVDKEDLTLVAHDVDNAISPIVANPKILVIPINLQASNTSSITNWTTSKLTSLNGYYFGNSPTSFVNYYKSMSHGYMTFSGIVSEVYNESSSNYTVEKINNDQSFSTLFGMMRRAVSWVKSNSLYSNVDWSEYDQDNNGTFDNIHFLTNYKATQWAGPLWPHMYTMGEVGTHSNPLVSTYSIGAINHTNDSITQIHEQGHIFGLDDYYDYSDDGQSPINYVGGADMQSHNMFDWNSYSKLSVGLASPYVITGGEDDFTIEIGDAVTTGDCIIVPANYDTWNGSAYDEYFLIELFSNKGLNAEFWDDYCTYYGDLGDYGIRMYHVDSRLYSLNTGREVSSIDPSTWGNQTIAIGPNNSSDYTACGHETSNPRECADMKLLTIIQKGGTDTFGSTSGRHFLNKNDLFQTGDTFTFANYAKFLSKSGADVTKMDNGETFTWKIDFESVTLDNARIRFYK